MCLRKKNGAAARTASILLLAVIVLSFAACRDKQGTIPANSLPTAATLSPLATSSKPAETSAPEPEKPVETRISFVGAGDNIIYFGNWRDAKSKAVSGGREYNFKPSYEKVADTIESADIAFINQETLMCGEGYELSGYPLFNSPQDVGYDLQESGFDIVNIATNHMLDKGAAGLSKTIEFWKNMNVMMIGGYENEEDFKNIRIYEESGVKIALLSFTYSTNGISLSSGSDLYIPYIDKEDIESQVAAAKAAADLVFVSVHWGNENSFTPSESQKEYARLMADCGVDAIIGHHPHVIQPIEWLTGKDGNKTLCVYSLGNFMAEMAGAYNMVGGFISFDIVKNGDNKPVLENVAFKPTVFWFSMSFYDNTVYPMDAYTDALAASHGVKNYGTSLSVEQARKYVTDTIDAEFLPDYLK